MKRIFNISVYALVLAVSVSCNDYLDVMPDNRTELDTPEKITSILVSAYANATSLCMQEMMSDNVSDYGTTRDVNYSIFEEAYRFDDITDDSFDSPTELWRYTYSAIACANLALEAIENLGGGESLNPQKGEALLCRAYGHFCLVNAFCQAYNTVSSSSDLGIPYVTEPESTVFVERSRETVADVYRKIAADIEAGFPLIDDGNYTHPKYHFNTTAAAAFAAQFYLYYGDYDKAEEYATMALGEDPSIYFRNWDLYTGTTADEYKQVYNSSEEQANFMGHGFRSRFMRYRSGRYFMTRDITVNETINGPTPWGTMSSSSSANPRIPYATAYQSSSIYYYSPKITEYFLYTDQVAGTGYPYLVIQVFTSEKTMIDRAEANAMLGFYDDAARDLNYFYHSLGFTVTLSASDIADYYADAEYNNPVMAPRGLVFADATQENLVKACLHARRLMTVQEGTRLNDLKRYGIAYTHTIDGEAPVEIAPYDLRLAIQLPVTVLSAGLEANPR